MKIESPDWQLVSERCDYCKEGELVFSKCPKCGVIVLTCGECSTVFEIKDKHKGKEVGEMIGGTKCHQCVAVLHNEFIFASAEEIQSMGFAKDDYK
jgi:uncharacterized OB-fold protein